MAQATTYYVDNDTIGCSAPDTNYDPTTELCGSGTFTVFKTLQGAANAVDEGDTVIVKDGLYNDIGDDEGPGNERTLDIAKSGTATAWITFKSENKWGAILDGNNDAIERGIKINSNSHYIRIENFEIRNYGEDGIDTVSANNISNIYIYGNHIHHIRNNSGAMDIGKSGIGTTPGTSQSDAPKFITIDSNIIHDIGKREFPENPAAKYRVDHGLYLNGRNQTVINNILFNNKAGWDILIGNKGVYSRRFI